MKRMAILSVALIMVGLVIGCNTSERGGKKDENTPGKQTFRLTGPTTATNIKQGDKQTIKLSLSRGSDFKKDVTLSADAPSGLKVDIEPKTVKASDKETAEATITVAKDAEIGEHKIKFTAKPSEGNAVDVNVSVKVEKKGD